MAEFPLENMVWLAFRISHYVNDLKAYDFSKSTLPYKEVGASGLEGVRGKEHYRTNTFPNNPTGGISDLTKISNEFITL